MEDLTLDLKNITEEDYATIMNMVEKYNKKGKRFIPKDNEYYWTINKYGCVDNHIFINDKINDFRLKQGNVFRTKEEAEFALEKMKVEAELRNFAYDNNDEIDMNDTFTNKWNIDYNYPNSTLAYDCHTSYFPQGSILFSSKELCEKAIETVGENRIKKYLFNAE